MFRTEVLIILLSTSCAGGLTFAEESELVLRQFPAELAQKEAGYLERSIPTAREVSFAAVNPGGAAREIFAVYSNGQDAGVRILAVAADGVVTPGPTYTGDELVGRHPDSELVEIDGQVGMEFSVTLTDWGGSDGTFLFKKETGALAPLNPVVEGKRQPFGAVRFVDVDGDGRKELVSSGKSYVDSGGDPVLTDSWALWRLENSEFKLASPLIFAGRYFRPKSASTVIEDGFNAVNGTVAQMLVINGGTGGRRIANARVWVNEQLVVVPSTLNAQTDRIEVPVTLLAENSFRLTLGGPNDSEVVVLFKPVD